MSKISVSGVVRDILQKDSSLSNDDVIKMAKEAGVNVPELQLKKSIYNMRTVLKRTPGPKAPVAVAAARATVAPTTRPTTTPAANIPEHLAQVIFASEAVRQVGGLDQARKLVDAIMVCGGPEQFKHVLDVVAAVRAGS